MNDAQREPAGDLVLRTLAMPSDTNPNGDIFGGWIMSQMDIGGAILAKEIAAGRVVTVAVDSTFHRPVKVGNVVCCYGKCLRIGNTSIAVKLEIWVKSVLTESHDDRFCVTEALFTYVAVDQQGKPRTIERTRENRL